MGRLSTECVALLPSLAIAAAGCTELDQFRTESDQVYRGTVAGTESDGECVEGRPCSFIRRGFPAGTELEMSFDPTQAGSDPGTLTTDDDQCGAPTFDETPLLPIAPLFHDQLGQYDFPGSGRVRNYIFLARPESGALAGREASIYVSLIREAKVEVRMIAGPGRDECVPSDCDAFTAGECDFFGVFRLDKEDL